MASATNIRGTALALTGGICWGFSGACAQYLFAHYSVDPVWVSSVRMLCAGIVLCVFAFALFRQPFVALLRSPRALASLLAFSIVGIAFTQISYLFAIQYSNAGTATVIQYTCPALIVVYLCVAGRRRPAAREVVAVALVIVGVFLLATHGDPTALALSPAALFWGLVSAVAYAIYSLSPRRLMARYGSVPVVALGLLAGGVVFSIALQSWTVDPGLGADGYLVLFGGLVLAGTIVGFSAYFQAVKDIGAAKASLISSIETVSATLFAVLWLGTEFVWIDIVGFVLIVATVFVLAKHEGDGDDAAQDVEAKQPKHA